jgi:S-sulfo-L-cysteine synthase (O-acetyl-L-serine-dependent)
VAIAMRSVAVAGPVSLLEMVGDTPLVRLSRIERDVPGVEMYAKAEWQNPGGSVKDRAAARMLAEGERTGALQAGKVILDATSGNTGIAYAMLGAARGYPVTLCVPGNVTPERLRVLRVFGAQVIATDPLDATDGAIHEARRLYAQDPDRYFYPDQYNNEANWRAHYDTTGQEILAQSHGRLTHLVAGLGTSGTFVGVGRRLRAHDPGIQLVSVEPDGPLHGIEGLKHMASALVPGIYDPSLADRRLSVSTEEAEAMARRLAAIEGLLVGVSSGAALAASLRAAREAGPGAVIVTIFPDGGSRYLSASFWDEAP